MKHTGVRLTLVVLEAFVALTYIVCGVGLAVGVIQFPLVWLQGRPFSDYTNLGLVMAIIVGGSAFLAAATIHSGREVGVLVSALAGLFLMGFEVMEVSIIDRNLGNWLFLVMKLPGWIKKEGSVFTFTEKGARWSHRFQMLFSLTFIDEVWTQCQREPWPKQIILY